MDRIFAADGWVFDALLCLDTYLGRPVVDRWLHGLRRRNGARLLARARRLRGDRDATGLGEIPARHELVPESFHRDFLAPSLPVVMRGLAKDFEAVARWSPEFFRDRYGDVVVETVDGERRAVRDEGRGLAEVHTKEMTVAEQVKAMLEGRSDYVSFWTALFVQHPELIGDVDVARLRAYLRPAWWSPEPIFKLFMGGGRTSTQWHCAELQNLFVQIHGAKEWLLCDPAWTPCFDPRIATLRQQYCHSLIDFREPDLDRHPLYELAPLQRVRLEPGDVLYVPPFWWHCVSNPDVSIGLALWWANLLPAWRANPTLLWLTVLSPQHLLRRAFERVQGSDPKTAVTTSTIFRAHGGRGDARDADADRSPRGPAA